MKVAGRDARERLVVLVPEVVDDLYHLAQLLSPGDRVRALTFRTPEFTDDVERRGKVEKRKMVLTLSVTDVSFQPFSDRLRVTGVIVEGPQDVGMHHTFNVEADGRNDLAVVKPEGWRRHHLSRIERAEAETRQPVLYILAIEDDEATIAEVRHYGVREISTAVTTGKGKQYAHKEDASYLDEVVGRVVSVRDPAAPLLVVGPGWTRERLVSRLKELHPEHAGGIITEGTGQSGMTGVHEAIRRGLIQRVVADHALTRDSALFDQLLASMGRSDGLSAYGPVDTQNALDLGAVATLLVTDEAVRTGKAAGHLARAEETATEVHVLSDAHEAGKRLAAFGGIAGLLRFPVPA